MFFHELLIEKWDGVKLTKDSGIIRYTIIAFLITSAILAFTSQFVIWASLDVDTKIGPGKASLEAEFYEHSVKYIITGNVSGGLISGIGGIGDGLAEGANIEIRENKTFLTGMGEFQENIGLILNSYKDREYTISISIWNDQIEEYEKTKLLVKTHTDLIPWWPEGVAQKYSVIVTLIKPGYIQDVVIKNVKIIMWRDFDDVNQVYTEASAPIDELSTNHRLSKQNESKTYDFDVTISKDYDRVGIIGVVDISIIDKQGNEVPENTIINLGNLEPIPGGLTHNIYTMNQGEAASIVLLVTTFPLIIVSLIFIILAIPLVFERDRWGSKIIFVAVILSMLAIIFYMNGILTLVDQLDSVLDTPVKDNFTWSYTLSLPIISIILLIVANILAFIIRPPKSIPVETKPGRREKPARSKKAKKPLPTFKVIEKSGDGRAIKGAIEDEVETKPRRKKKKHSKKRKS